MKKTLLLLLTLFLISGINGYAQKENLEGKRALIISGGGTRGSWGAGFAKGLRESGTKYDIVGGASAGALIMTSVALKQFDELETVFNTITNNDVYSVNPIRSNGKIKTLKSAWRTLMGHPSIGESKNLRLLIEDIFTEEDYNEIKKQDMEVFCIVTNLNTAESTIKSNLTSSYSDMLDWIWASASVPILMKPVSKDGFNWADGGLLDNVPIDEAIIEGSKIIDIIALFQEETDTWEYSDNLKDIAGRTSKIVLSATFKDKIIIGKLMSALEEGTVLNIHYMSPEDSKFLSNLYSFDNRVLSEGFKRGYNAFKNETMTTRSYRIGGNSEFIEMDNKD